MPVPIASIKTWRFQPGTKNGKPVPVRAKIEVNFRLLIVVRW